MITKRFQKGISLLLATSAMLVSPLLQIGVLTQYAQAAGLTSVSDTMSKQGVSDTADHTIVWTNATSNTAGDTITVDFTQADIVASGTWQTTDFALTDGSHSAQAPLNIGGACTATDNYIVAATNATSTFLITLCSGWTTSTSPTTLLIKGATGGTGVLTNKATDVDSSIYTITYTGASTNSGTGVLVVETNADVAITATVGESLTFSNDDAAIGFGPLSMASNRWATADASGSNSDATAHTLTASTNATAGYSITVFGALLTSGANNIDSIGTTATTLASAGTNEELGLRLVATGGSGTASAPYDQAAQYAYDGTATPDVVASSSVPTATTSYAVHYAANIDSGTASGSYSTTLYYVATGNF